EVATPAARRRKPSAVINRQPIDSASGSLGSERAVLPDEEFTPMPSSEEKRGRRLRNVADDKSSYENDTVQDAPAVVTPTPTLGMERGNDSKPKAKKNDWLPLIALMSVVVLMVLLFWPREQKTEYKDKPSPTVTIAAGVLNVFATPSKAEVRVDGAQRCKNTPCRLGGLPQNRELLVTVHAPGYNVWMQRVVLASNEPILVLRAHLTPASPPTEDNGKAPEGKAATDNPPQKGATKRAGKTGKAKTHVARSQKGNAKITTVDNDPRYAQMAILVIEVRPWAEVWIDGQKVGPTPVQLQIDPGKRIIELKNPEYSFNKTYKIIARKGKKVKIMDEIPPSSQPPALPPPGTK
ncbi:MAG: PEGA domain-containing protein, partial [Pseudomonadota bacterium]